MTDQPSVDQQHLKPTLDEDVRELYSRVAKLNDIASALLNPSWGANMGILPEGHPLHPGALEPPETANERTRLLARAEAAEAEVARLRAGEDTTPVQPEAVPTPAQWIARWNNATSGQRLDMAARVLDMQQEQLKPPEHRLFQVGWYCWRCHGLVEKACRSDNVPVYVPLQWVQEMAREIAERAEESDGPDAAGSQE